MEIKKIVLICCGALIICARSLSQTEMPAKATEVWSPVPPQVVPPVDSEAPSDAVVLFMDRTSNNGSA